MKIDILKISVFLVVINTLSMLNDLPPLLIGYVLGIVLLSFFILNKKMRSFIKFSSLAFSFGLLLFLFKTYIVTEAGVSFVLILSALKLWELNNETDHFNMFLILALSECCLFLLNPTLLVFTIGLVKILIFFYFILKIRSYDLALLSGKRLFFLVLPSLLFSLLLFYTFPRFTQGFVTASNGPSSPTGTSSELNLSRLGSLNLSSRIVFKVFGLPVNQLPIPILYWRQKILWTFDNEEWSTGYLNLKGQDAPITGQLISYKVQAIQKNLDFIPVLDGVTHLTSSNFEYNFYNEVSFKLKPSFREPFVYEAQTSTKEPIKLYSPLMEKKALGLRSKQKDLIRKLVLGAKKNSINMGDQEKLDAAISFFKERKFEYTLNPQPFYSTVDFILRGKEGYCSHFAAAFAYIGRAVGLPTRIVSGYQGGEFNPFDNSVIVRELDGHIWNEVYLKDVGWYRFDPTTLVAPGRIQMGSAFFNDNVDPYINLYYYQLPKSFLKFKSLSRLSLWLETFNSQVSSNILFFDQDSQRRLFETYFPKSFSLGWIFALILSSSMVFFWMLFYWLNKKALNPHEVRFNNFQKKMNRHGLYKLPHETALLFQARCLSQHPKLVDFIKTETNHYIKFFYERS